VCLEAYRWACEAAAARGIPLATHLAESPEEREFVRAAAGPMRELLERLGIWDDSITVEVGRGASPVAHVAPVLAGASAVVAHVNDASDADLALLAAAGPTVVYCPRASEYFGAHEHFGPHRYRDMIAVGINVALGTDSLVNLPPTAAKTPSEGGIGMSILEEMRLLWRRDGTDPRTLLAMGTINGARALNLTDSFRFEAGAPIAGLVGVQIGRGLEQSGSEPVEEVLSASSPAQLLFD
jgi:cytosine/adenosine deaminase-related metal-dependent hydrolase